MSGKPRGPEDVSFEIGASYIPIINTGLSGLDGAENQVFACLNANRGDIVNAEQTFRVSRLAIAGAIAWEMLENKRKWSPRSVGMGKIHLYNYHLTRSWYDTAANQAESYGYLPFQSRKQREILLATPSGAIRYIAAIMAGVADIAGRLGFEDIRSDPIVLTNIYQSMDLKEWEQHLKTKPKGSTLGGGNPMDVWVSSHINFVIAAVGQPDLPESEKPSTALRAPSGPLQCVAPNVGDKTVQVLPGSTLSAIAKAEYGNFDLWPLIYDLNKGTIGANPNTLQVGIRLSIPSLSRFTSAQIADAKRRAPSWKKY